MSLDYLSSPSARRAGRDHLTLRLGTPDVMAHEHGRESDDDAGRKHGRERDGLRTPDAHPLERAVDRSGMTGSFNRLNAKIAEYRSLVYLAAGILLFFGWKFEGPGGRLSKVEQRTGRLEMGQKRTHDALDVIIRLRCFDTTVTFEHKRLAGLDCSDIERARRARRGTDSIGSPSLMLDANTADGIR